jgi:tRNA threonylcarbamoyladenosine biosynthesis protein TsaB
MGLAEKIIVIETSGRVGGAALACGSQILCEEQFTGDQQHTSQLFPLLDSLCKSKNWTPDQVDEIYVSVGPGSFTGLRVGITAAKTLAFARSIKVVSVPSTDVIALNFLEKSQKIAKNHEKIDNLAVVMDAKRGEVYTSVFTRIDPSENCDDQLVPGFRVILPPSVMSPAELLANTPRPLAILGEGLRWHHDQFCDPDIITLEEKYWQPLARNVHRCGQLRARAGLYVDPDQLTPLYLRRPEAVEKWEQLHGQ